MGMIYLRGHTWWVKYYRDGKPYRESAKTGKETEAKKYLQRREGQVVDGNFQGLKVEKITFEDLKKDLINDYMLNGKRSLDRAELSIKHLEGFFKGVKVININTNQVERYILKRKQAGACNGTVNRELSALRRMMSLGTRQTPKKVINPPFIPKLQEADPREVFFEHDEYQRLRVALPDHLKPVLTMGYLTGMRKREVLNLQWDQVSIFERKITLHASDTKNKKPRVIYLAGELYDCLKNQLVFKEKKYPSCKYVFFREAVTPTGETEAQQIKNFQASWRTACKKATISGKVFHDLRRSGVRNLVRSGVSETVAMKISGHKTRSIFQRYNITNEDDLKQAAQRLDTHLKEIEDTRQPEVTGTNPGTIQVAGAKG
ncbi:MAG: tyrosine-type recombinase/integrase [Syntrophales bacterium]